MDATALMRKAVLVPRPGVGHVEQALDDAPLYDPKDPPGFFLQASPSFAGGNLPDGVWQRVPIGAAGQVLTVDPTGTFVQWLNSPSGFANPMLALGDLIDGAAGGTPQRLPIGSTGQVLTVVGGVPVWQNASSGFSNPMTTAGDIIYENVTPAPARLAARTSVWRRRPARACRRC